MSDTIGMPLFYFIWSLLSETTFYSVYRYSNIYNIQPWYLVRFCDIDRIMGDLTWVLDIIQPLHYRKKSHYGNMKEVISITPARKLWWIT